MGDQSDERSQDVTNHANGDLKDRLIDSTDTTGAERTILPESHDEDHHMDKPVGEPARDPQPSQQDKADSEAETEIEAGKGDEPNQQNVKAIKMEDEDEQADLRAGSEKETRENGNESVVPTGHRSMLKRKRGEEQPHSGDEADKHDSSDLSSNRSSPVPQARSSKTSESRSASRSATPTDEGDQDGKPRQRTAQRDRKTRKRHSSQHNTTSTPKSTHNASNEKRQVSNPDRKLRSESPQSTLKSRARSIQPNGTTQSTTRRRKPTPLNVDRRRKTSEDIGFDSDDSNSVDSHPHARRLPSGDSHIMSPAKISDKKNRDRSGRTLLARACSGGLEEAKKLMKERPQDIDVPDYAGNTPLQTASLAGHDEIVELLIIAGCDTTCKNGENDTPLIDAVENGHLRVVQLLLDAGVDPRQRNAKGQEPVELVDLDSDDGEAIRDALLKARKESEAIRRQSEDHRAQMRDPEHVSVGSLTESTRSPPPVFEVGGRRRGARGQQTDNALLYVNPTPQRLKDEAGKGNYKFVAHILNMGAVPDTDAMIAAVKGGHDEILGLMIGMGAPEPDPQPSSHADQQPGQNTPILAAIGRGNLKVVSLLVNQDGFDPTRRVYRNMTYPEIAVDRKGDNWEKERDILQEAMDKHIRTSGRSANSTPRRSRKQKPVSRETKDDDSEPSSSPQETRKVRKTHSQVQEDAPRENRRKPTYQGTAVKHRHSSEHEALPSSSERVSSHADGLKSKSANRPRSSGQTQTLAPPSADAKPKRRLMSGNDLKTEKGRSRANEDLGAMQSQSPEKPKHRQSFSHGNKTPDPPDADSHQSGKQKKASSEEPARGRDDAGKKRLRNSMSPATSKSEILDGSKKKKQKLNASATDNDTKDTADPNPTIGGLPLSSSPPSVKSPGQGAAPVAFMGAPTAGPTHPPATETSDSVAAPSKANDVPARATQNGIEADPSYSSTRTIDAGKESSDRLEQEQRDAQLKQEAEANRKQLEAERLQRLKAQEEERILDSKRRAEEEERQAKEAERRAKEAEEAARLERARRDEEMQRQRAQEDAKRREELERKRQEREAKEAVYRKKLEDEAKRAKMEALPNGLRRVVEIGPELARRTEEIDRWLPIRTATTKDLDPSCSAEGAEDRWMANIQAAPLLANQDLELSQYTAWNRRPATAKEKFSLWRQLRGQMAWTPDAPYLSGVECYEVDNATNPKFFQLNVFWLRVSDFLDIVPRHRHLAGREFKLRAMLMDPSTVFRRKSQPRASSSSPQEHRGENAINGSLTREEGKDLKQ